MATNKRKQQPKALKKLKKKPDEKVVAAFSEAVIDPIYYINRTNYTEIAATICETFIRNIHNVSAFGGPVAESDIDLEAFSEFLDKGLTHDALTEFLRTDFGKGILLGSYFEYRSNKDKEDEIKALQEQGLDEQS